MKSNDTLGYKRLVLRVLFSRIISFVFLDPLLKRQSTIDIKGLNSFNPVNNTLEMIDAMNETIKNNDYREFCKKNVLIRSNDFKKNFILDQYLDYIIK